MRKAFFFVLLVIVSFTSCVRTEVEVNGNISGFVREKESAKVIAGCSISLEPGNNQIYSSEDGSYSFIGLQMGDYKLTASKSGYEILTEAITISAGKTLNHDIMLTHAKAPMVSTDSVRNLLANSATLYGTIVDMGGAAITKKGFYIGTDSTQLSVVYSLDQVDSISSFLYNLVDLEDGKTYYFCAFAVNEIGEGRGGMKAFSTKELYIPSVKTSSATNIGTTTAILHGVITDNGNCQISQCGFYVGLSPTPNQKYTYPSNEESILDFSINNLKSNTTYYYCIFAENQKGKTKGDVLSFKTLETSKPIVYTNNAVEVTSSSATLRATLSDNGGCEVLEYGFYIGESTASMVKQKVENIQNNLYSYKYGNLYDGHTYYFQAYAINERGESRGEVKSFKTNQLALPELVTKDVTNISYTSANLNATITSNGSSNIKEYGFYYGIYSNPTTKIKVGNGNAQNYSFPLSNLSPNTTYYIKAYALNEKGEGCGDIKSFRTMAYSIPQVQTNSATNVTDRSAICTGTVISNGGQAILEQGICYSLEPNPTINDSHVASSISSTSIKCEINKLMFSKTYYYRAYAKNSVGVNYGASKSFKTEDASYSAGLDGVFSISRTQRVIFSGGNLQYKASTNEWQFAKNQYDVVGASNVNINASYNGWIDLFGWGTGSNPTLTSNSGSDYRTFVDWGNNSINGVEGVWRTLTTDEWRYLFKRYNNCATFAIVNGVRGWIILPDSWELPQSLSMEFYSEGSYTVNVTTTKNKYSISQWKSLENSGAVFLPVTGRREQLSSNNSSIKNLSGEAFYWTSTYLHMYGASISNDKTSPIMGDSYYNSYDGTAHAVRLVQER